MNWWQRLLRSKKMERQLENELKFHLEQHEADLIARGVHPAEARRRARLAIGGPEQVKEECRDARGTRWLEDFWADFRYALRILRSRPGFAGVALLTLALGIGATTLMFTLVNGVLLKPLPFPDPSRLVQVNGESADWNAEAFGKQNLAYLDFVDCARESRSLDLAAALFDNATVSEPGEPEYVDVREISSNLFSVVGVPLLQGRTFMPDEEKTGAAPVAILGYSFWQRHLGGRPDAVGSSIVIDLKRYTIVGIARAGFRLYGEEADVYTPVGQDTAKYLQNRAAHPIHALGRLRAGRTLGEAQAEFTLFGQHLAQEFKDTNAGRTFTVAQLRPDVGDVRATLWLLLGAVSLVLLIACTNVASLLLARAVSRERELAMRVALGATRGRLVRQCLTESAVLGLSGGALGIVLAAGGLQPFVAFWPGALPRAEEVQVDWHVLLFAAGVSLLSSFLFGVAPALRAPFKYVEQALRAGMRSISGGSRRLHGVFVVSEIALAIILLVSAGMLGRTLLHSASLDPGVDIHNVLVTRMALSPATLADPGKTRAAWKDVLERARRVPGVQSLATVDTFPMREGDNEQGYWTSADVPPTNKLPFALLTSVSPDYLKVMGIRLRRGRFFDDHDTLDSTPVIVIDDVLAQNAFGVEDPIGKRLWIPDMGYGGNVFQIVGVVGHVRQWGLAADDEAKVRAQIYYPFSQLPDNFMHRWSQLMSIAVRTDIPPLAVVSSLRSELKGAAGDQVLYEVRTMEQLASESLAQQRFLLLLFSLFAGVALVLACVGIYGVLAYLTGQRVPEMGVRIALGASAGDVMWLVLRQSLEMIVVGVAIGTAAAVAAERVLLRSVAGMQPTALASFAMMIPLLVAAALLASFLPARRASRVDPVVALRQD
ncbi:MAG TPA: ABC transporter permease [Candidatus Methylomirabilis sp.]|nr:ABC transporter permease [Candidatus Methylomirabilis sp.]